MYQNPSRIWLQCTSKGQRKINQSYSHGIRPSSYMYEAMLSRLTAAVLFLITFVLFGSDDALFLHASAAPVALPLCGSAKGFAGELNYEFSLVPNVEVDWRRGEAIVIGVRPIPFNPNDPAARSPAFVDARYAIGNESFRFTSSPDGLLTIANPIPMGTIVDITVRNARLDGATPFVLYSYVSNKPYCFIDIGPSKAFLGPVPGSANGSPPSIYFTSAPPTGVSTQMGTSSAFKFGVTTGVPVSVWHAASSTDMMSGRAQPLQMGREVTWARPGPLYIEVRPSFQGLQPAMMRAIIDWRLLDGPDEGNEYSHGNNNANGYGSSGSKNAWPSHNGNNNNYGNQVPNYPPLTGKGKLDDDDADEEDEYGHEQNSGGKKTPTIASRSLSAAAKAFKFVGYLSLFGVLYFMVGSVVNYKVKAIHSFPEYIPHYEAVGSLLVFVGATARAVRNKASRSRGGYSGVNSAEAEEV